MAICLSRNKPSRILKRVPDSQRSGTRATYTGHFTAVFDGNGKNLAPNGAKSVTLDGKTGALVAFES